MAIYYNGQVVGNVDLTIKNELANDNIWIQDTEPAADVPEGSIWVDTSLNVDDAREIAVDNNMSDTSTNPVQNKVVKAYADQLFEDANYYTDNSKAQMVALVENKSGVVSATIAGIMNYDLLVYYAKPAPDAYPVCGVIPIKGLNGFYGNEIPVCVANATCYTWFHFHASGFYTKNFSSDGQGKIIGLYGITF